MMPFFQSQRLGAVLALALSVFTPSLLLLEQQCLCHAQTLPALVTNEPSLSTLLAALQAANLATTLGGTGPFTVFAPVNDAFENIDPELLTRYLEESGWNVHLTNLLLYHVAAGEYNSTELTAQANLTMLNDDDVTFAFNEETEVLVLNEEANVTLPDQVATNGIAHLIDSVLVPEFMSKTVVDVIVDDLESPLVPIILAANLGGALATANGITIFLPSDEAIAAIPETLVSYLTSPAGQSAAVTLLGYHVLNTVVPRAAIPDGSNFVVGTFENSGNLTVVGDSGAVILDDRVEVIRNDILASNGIIHVVDELLVPASLFRVLLITETLSTLLSAVITAGLTGALLDPTVYTVFAPNDEAFVGVDQNLLAKLLTPEWVAHLNGLILYHVAAGAYDSTALANNLTSLEMLNGETVGITQDGVGFLLNNEQTRVVTPDAADTPNGIAHIINNVLLPGFLNSNVVVVATSELSVLAELVVLAELEETLRNTEVTVFGPTDEAFAALDEETLTFLRSDDGRASLVEILTYHVVGSVIPSALIANGDTDVESVEGNPLMISKDAATGSVTINTQANVVTADVLASNGIIHVIDAVLTIPSNETAPPSVDSAAAPATTVPNLHSRMVTTMTWGTILFLGSLLFAASAALM